MKGLITKIIAVCMVLSSCSLSLARGFGGGGAMHAGGAFHGGFDHGGNINRGNFSHNTFNRSNYYGGYGRGGWGPYWGGAGLGLATGAMIGAASSPTYVPEPYPVYQTPPSYSSQDVVQQQQQEISQLQSQVRELENR